MVLTKKSLKGALSKKKKGPLPTCRSGRRKRASAKEVAAKRKKELFGDVNPLANVEVPPLLISSPKRGANPPTVAKPKRGRRANVTPPTGSQRKQSASSVANRKDTVRSLSSTAGDGNESDREEDSSRSNDNESPSDDGSSQSDDADSRSGDGGSSSDDSSSDSDSSSDGGSDSVGGKKKAGSDGNRSVIVPSKLPVSARRTSDELDCPFLLPTEETKLHPPKTYVARAKVFREVEKHNIDDLYLVPKNNPNDGSFLMFHPDHSVQFSVQILEYAAKVATQEVTKSAARWPVGRLARFTDKPFKKMQDEAGIVIPQVLRKPDSCRREFPLLQPHVLKVAVALKHLMGTIAVLYIRLAPQHSLFYAPLQLHKPSDKHLENVGQIAASQPPFFGELSRQALIYLPTVVPEFNLSATEMKLAMCEAHYRMNETFAMRIKASNRMLRRQNGAEMGNTTNGKRNKKQDGKAIKKAANTVPGDGGPPAPAKPKQTSRRISHNAVAMMAGESNKAAEEERVDDDSTEAPRDKKRKLQSSRTGNANKNEKQDGNGTKKVNGPDDGLQVPVDFEPAAQTRPRRGAKRPVTDVAALPITANNAAKGNSRRKAPVDFEKTTQTRPRRGAKRPVTDVAALPITANAAKGNSRPKAPVESKKKQRRDPRKRVNPEGTGVAASPIIATDSANSNSRPKAPVESEKKQLRGPLKDVNPEGTDVAALPITATDSAKVNSPQKAPRNSKTKNTGQQRNDTQLKERCSEKSADQFLDLNVTDEQQQLVDTAVMPGIDVTYGDIDFVASDSENDGARTDQSDDDAE